MLVKNKYINYRYRKLELENGDQIILTNSYIGRTNTVVNKDLKTIINNRVVTYYIQVECLGWESTKIVDHSICYIYYNINLTVDIFSDIDKGVVVIKHAS